MKQKFHIGQKVVRTGPTVTGICTKGVIYTIKGILTCVCGGQHLAMHEFPPCDDTDVNHTDCCGWAYTPSGLYYGKASRFAPIMEQYIDVTAELAKDAVPETADVQRKEVRS